MSAVLDKLIRLRRYTETIARQDLVSAQNMEQTTATALAHISARVAKSSVSVNPSVATDVAMHHAYSLKMEMVRRTQVNTLITQKRAVSVKRNDLREASVQSRILTRLAELRDEVMEDDARKSSQRTLDEVGALLWARR